MTRRTSTIFAAAAVFAASAPAALLAQPPAAESVELSEARRTPAEQQAAAYKDKNWTAPRTSWGHPSLQGTWSTDDMRGIPRERPEALGTQESLSQEQFIERATTQQTGRDARRDDRDVPPQRVGHAHVRFHVARRRSAERPHAAAQRCRPRAPGGFGGSRHVQPDQVRLVRRLLALRPLHRRSASAAAWAPRSTATASAIFQSPDAVTITYEMIHETRVIHARRAGRTSPACRSSRATRAAIGTATRSSSRPAASPTRRASAAARTARTCVTTERIRRVDPEMIEYRITINDPDTYTAPFTVRTMWTTQPNYYAYEYSCHEGNFAVARRLGRRTCVRAAGGRGDRGGHAEPPKRSGGEIYRDPEEGAQVFDINAASNAHGARVTRARFACPSAARCAARSCGRSRSRRTSRRG